VVRGEPRAVLDLFGDHLLVLLHDDIVSNPPQVHARAICHVRASPGFVPPTLAEVVFSNRGEGGGAVGLSAAERRQLFDDYFRDDVDRL
jgi:hypothetical protein